MVLLAPLLALGSKSTSLSAGIYMWLQAVRYDLFSSADFLPYFGMLILSLPLLGLGSLYVDQGSTIQFVGSWISFLGYLLFFWLMVWANRINKCGWCLAGGRRCWLKGLHKISSVIWIFIIPYSSTFIRLSHLYQEFCVHCIVSMNDSGMG